MKPETEVLMSTSFRKYIATVVIFVGFACAALAQTKEQPVAGHGSVSEFDRAKTGTAGRAEVGRC